MSRRVITSPTRKRGFVRPALALRDVLRACIAGVLLAVVQVAAAQALDERQLQARVRAVDDMVAPIRSGPEAAAFLAGFAAGDALAPFAVRIAEPTARQTWSAALEEVRRLLQEAGESMLPLPAASRLNTAATSVAAATALHERLRRFPPTTTAAQRTDADETARQLFERWRAASAPVELRRILREAGLSSWGPRAADTLGDLAFEAGEIADAYAWWRRAEALAALETEPRRQAKQILALIFLDQFVEAEQALAQWRRERVNLAGTLAGRTGAYADILEHWLVIRRSRREEGSAVPWTMFGGGPTRGCAPPLRLHSAQEVWRVRLADVHPGDARRRDAADHIGSGASAPFPVIAGGQVLVGIGSNVMSFDLGSAKPRFVHNLEAPLPEAQSGEPPPAPMLSARGGRAFAVAPGRLVALGITAGDAHGKVLWHAKAETPDGEPAAFQGDALVAGDRIFVVAGQRVGVRRRYFLGCRLARLGVPIWLKPLHEGHALAASPSLLTWAGDRIVYATHQGQVGAIDPDTGQPLWQVRYPSTGKNGGRRHPVPAISAAGRVLVAPSDAALLLCIEAATGQVLWELPAVEVTQLLGVSDGMVVFATRHGLQGVDVRTGGAETRWQQPSGGRLASAGRGLLGGGLVYWPTQDAGLPLRALAIRTGDQDDAVDPSRLRAIPPGNLAFGEDRLVVATPGELVVFAPAKSPPAPSE